MLIYELKSGEKVFRRDNTIIVDLPGLRRVVGTSRLNGGYREDLQAVFNHHIPPGNHKAEDLEGGSVEAYLEIMTARLGLPHRHTTGLLTAAAMENAAIRSKGFRDLEVTAVVTGGVEVNGGRAGDPASYYENNGRWVPVGGTINIILIIDGDLPPRTMVRSIVTATEAKTAVLQELMARSHYSRGIATGSGTDGIIVVANPNSGLRFTDAGKHSKLGELIGLVVKEATKEALEKQTGLNHRQQRNFLVRLERFGVTAEDFWQQALREGTSLTRDAYMERLNQLAVKDDLVVTAAGLLHLLDEQEWGLLPADAVVEVGSRLVQTQDPRPAVISCSAGGQDTDPAGRLISLFIGLVNRSIR